MEPLKHECGVVMIRLLKPLSYYHRKYGTWQYGLNKLYLMMEKQHNRGQEGAGISCVKLSPICGEEYMFRERALGSGAISEIFGKVQSTISDYSVEESSDPTFAKRHIPFAGELYMGHLRYSTTGKSGLSYVHPFLRRNNWRSKNLCMCGNFNMTNVNEIFQEITQTGQHPRIYSDTYIMLEQMGHRLDRESERLFDEAKSQGLKGQSITDYIDRNIKVENMLKTSAPLWDGGYVVCGQTGSGEMFCMRDPNGIRPAFYYYDKEILVVTSERPVIQTALDVEYDSVHELPPGSSIICSQDGKIRFCEILPQGSNQACSFERIYFSRGSDRDIYQERKSLGRQLVPRILQSIDNDIEHTVFSFIPNTAEVAYYGMLEGLDQYLNSQKLELIKRIDCHSDHKELDIDRILSMRIRSEKVALKDIKLRTFITESNSRNDLADHVYDITYVSIEPHVDNLVIIDDSIVRGTTLRESIIRILARLHPKKIVIVSSSPQVRYPDYYGIDMSRMSEFIAFRAVIELLRETGKSKLIDKVYYKCKSQYDKYLELFATDLVEARRYKTEMQNYVHELYSPFSAEEISSKMVKMLTSDDIACDVEIVYQSLEGLHAACASSPGDWYFSGDYPTPGGTCLITRAYIEWYERKYEKDSQLRIHYS